ncbi:hypothetical protein QBC46DRAFT_376444 [Diplogelasinospora grovesii]|uniref:RNA-binding S4 domain-containing protein n=1 Tax=Diplogelasinospora grovesii TaxID=303347 RepID=A0AAN6NHN1_9PEZI|nr:hypothetical protein QBC46DRAFT_376444 [Diplogelasinospora grovesii]
MKYRRIERFHGLKRPRIRQTWNKYNLYNLQRARMPRIIQKTFFQQKWIAKALTRGYHGEHIKERQWERMFSRRLLSVVNMDPKYMARHDGSEQAAGRGSGLELPLQGRQRAEQGVRPVEVARNGGQRATKTPTPYMQMTYAPMERRLDVAVFRALFASSARQARQFVVHGAVKVNGKKMVYPGYLLNPGDLFQVNIERVMTATGRKKETGKKKMAAAKAASAGGEPAEAEEAEAKAAAEGGEEAAETTREPADEVDEETAKANEAAALKKLLSRAKFIVSSPNQDLSVKRKQAIRALIKDVKTAMARASSKKNSSLQKTGNVVDDLTTLLSQLELSPAEAKEKAEEAEAVAAKEKDEGLPTEEERALLKKAIEEELENPSDPTKPYATPWRPRPYMAPFAFIPRYLEVNQNICAAVYLRHPVARQGQAEVPTPFSPELSQLAFNWYLRRG